MTAQGRPKVSLQRFLKSFKNRFPAEEVISRLKSLRKLRVLVIGETILDDYHFVTPIGKSPKGTHIAAEFIREEMYAGGVLACANHVAGFCGKVDLVTAIGRNDQRAPFVKEHLKSNIRPHLFLYDKAPTIVKRRFLDHTYSNKLFEIYIFKDNLALDLEGPIGDFLADSIEKKKAYDLVLVVDYGHGLLTPRLVNLLSDSSAFLAVNAQTNTANIGFNPVTKYARANYFCLGEPELHIAFQDKHGEIHHLMERLAEQVSLPGAVSVTRGPRGSIVYDATRKIFSAVPALSQKIVDTVGAGDAFLSITAPCVARKFPAEFVSFIGNAAGSLAMETMGNKTPVEPRKLYKFIRGLLN